MFDSLKKKLNPRNKPKEVKNRYNKNYKTVKKEIEEDTKKMKRPPMLTD
jgi:reverse gyrase